MISIANTTNNKKARNMHGINDFNLGKCIIVVFSIGAILDMIF